MVSSSILSDLRGLCHLAYYGLSQTNPVAVRLQSCKQETCYTGQCSIVFTGLCYPALVLVWSKVCYPVICGLSTANYYGRCGLNQTVSVALYFMAWIKLCNPVLCSSETILLNTCGLSKAYHQDCVVWTRLGTYPVLCSLNQTVPASTIYSQWNSNYTTRAVLVV